LGTVISDDGGLEGFVVFGIRRRTNNSLCRQPMTNALQRDCSLPSSVTGPVLFASRARGVVLDFVAICSYIVGMKTVSIRDAKNRLTELAREVERGETIVVTRNGRPAFDLVPHQTRKGLRLEAIDEFKRKHRIKAIVPYIANDFDEPLQEDFLLRPLPIDR
jgi:prevent-host-death family protein